MQQQMRKSAIKICVATFMTAFMLSGCYVDRPAYDGMSTETVFEEARICAGLQSTSTVQRIFWYREGDRDLAVSQHQNYCEGTRYELDGQWHRYFLLKKWDRGPVDVED